VTARSGAQDPSGAAAERAQNQASPDRTAAGQAPAGKPAASAPAAGQAPAGKPAAVAAAASRAAAPGQASAPGQAARLPYEQARDELTDLVKRLEAGGLTLEQSLELWERGERLADICAEWLEGARARLATAMARRDDTSADAAAPF
jgi:exodeoxyribonuclease VII small subunit